MDIGEAGEEIAGGGLGFLELAGTNEVGCRIGGGGQLILVIDCSEPGKECGSRRTLF
jgi:hypothetical protein